MFYITIQLSSLNHIKHYTLQILTKTIYLPIIHSRCIWNVHLFNRIFPIHVYSKRFLRLRQCFYCNIFLKWTSDLNLPYFDPSYTSDNLRYTWDFLQCTFRTWPCSTLAVAILGQQPVPYKSRRLGQSPTTYPSWTVSIRLSENKSIVVSVCWLIQCSFAQI